MLRDQEGTLAWERERTNEVPAVVGYGSASMPSMTA